VIEHLLESHSIYEQAAEKGICLRYAYRRLARYCSGCLTSLANQQRDRRTQRRMLDRQQLQEGLDLRNEI